MNADVLSALTATADDTAQERLRARLTEEAAQAGLLDVAYRIVDSPVGSLLLAATERGLIRVAYACEDHSVVLSTLAARVSPRILRAPRRLDLVAVELDEYFSGRRQLFDQPIDLQLARGFRRTVLEHLRSVEYGRTASYGVLATASGSSRAVRAVGSACATNPLPVVVPCHRIVRSDGSIGQYVGGVDAKQALLTLEARGQEQIDAQTDQSDPLRAPNT